jgi:hypothetical protein
VNLEKLTGLQMKILRNAISSAFVSTNSLNQFLREELDKAPLEDITTGNNREERTFSLIRVAEAEGWLTELVEKLQAYRPNNVVVRRLPDALRLGEAKNNAVAPNDQMSLEKIVRNSGYEDLRLWAEKMSEIGEATCRIEVRLERGTLYGTGLLVADDLVLTNYHVVEDHIRGQKDPADIGCRFDYAMDLHGLNEGNLVPLVSGPEWLAASSPYDVADISGSGLAAADHLDFALLRLNTAVGQQDIGNGLRRGRIALANPLPPTPIADDPVFIVQHPLGKPMALAIGKVLGLDASGVRLRYDADTEGGSSGSGVFDQRLRLVALHNAGDPTAKTRAAYNQGIPIGKIVEMLAGKIDLPGPKTDVSISKVAKKLPRRVLAGLIGFLVLSAVLAPIVWYRLDLLASVFGSGRPIGWTEIPNVEIHRRVAVRQTWSDTAPKLARELSPGDVEDFGNSPPVRSAILDRKRWYGISLRNLDNEVYLSEADASGALAQWKKIDGCLKAKQPETEVFRATLNGSPISVYSLGAFIPMSELQTATLDDVVWFRFRYNDSKFRYLSTAKVEWLGPANCPSP